MEEIKNIRQKGLNGFQIKAIAVVLMLLDHIYYIFGFTGKVPVLFSQLGRLAGYLFMFLLIEGFLHTRSRKKYIARIYGMSVFMGTMNYLIVCLGLVRQDGFYPINNVFATFTLLLLIWQGIEWVQHRQFKKAIGILALLILPTVCLVLLPQSMMPVVGLLTMTVLPVPTLVEGGIFWLLSGVILYVFRNRKVVQGSLFVLYTLLWSIGMPIALGMDLTITNIFTMYYEWMGIFAIPLWNLYNGEKGKSMKGFFYTFYPAHVYGLYALSFFVIKQ